MATPSAYTHFKCNDNAANTTVTDDGSGANNGTASTNTSNLSTTGKINQAFDFESASSEYVGINNLITDIGSDTSGSFAVWFNADGLANQSVISFGDTNGDSVFNVLPLSNGAIRVIFVNAGVNEWIHQGGSYDTGTWCHLVVIQNGTSPVVYVNAVDVTNLTGTTDTTVWFADCAGLDNGYIAAKQSNSQAVEFYFNGLIDDIRYYQNQTLTFQDVKNIYRGGVGTEDDPPPLYSPFPYSQGLILT